MAAEAVNLKRQWMEMQRHPLIETNLRQGQNGFCDLSRLSVRADVIQGVDEGIPPRKRTLLLGERIVDALRRDGDHLRILDECRADGVIAVIIRGNAVAYAFGAERPQFFLPAPRIRRPYGTVDEHHAGIGNARAHVRPEIFRLRHEMITQAPHIPSPSIR